MNELSPARLGALIEHETPCRLLMRSRNALERLFRDAGVKLRVGSELCSNESLKQMCIAGFGPAYMSMHTCVLEMEAGLLKMLPLEGNPVMREWFVVRAASPSPPQIALAFENFLCEEGQAQISDFVGTCRLPARRGRRGVAPQPRPRASSS